MNVYILLQWFEEDLFMSFFLWQFCEKNVEYLASSSIFYSTPLKFIHLFIAFYTSSHAHPC